MTSAIPQIARILHPTDMSENAAKALRYAASLALRFNAVVTVLHILDEGSPNTRLVLDAILGKDGWEKTRRSLEVDVIKRVREKIENFCRKIMEDEPKCPYVVDEVIVEVGHPVHGILHYIQKTNADMVVMGSRGHGVLKDMILGSTSYQVLRRSTVPVLIVPK